MGMKEGQISWREETLSVYGKVEREMVDNLTGATVLVALLKKSESTAIGVWGFGARCRCSLLLVTRTSLEYKDRWRAT